MCVLTTCVLVFDSYAGKHDRSGSCVIEHGRIDIKTHGSIPLEARSGSCVMEHGRILACTRKQGVWKHDEAWKEEKRPVDDSQELEA